MIYIQAAITTQAPICDGHSALRDSQPATALGWKAVVLGGPHGIKITNNKLKERNVDHWDRRRKSNICKRTKRKRKKDKKRKRTEL